MLRLGTAMLALLLTACGGGDRPSDAGIGSNPNGPCSGSCQDTATRLQVAEVQDIVAQSVAEAQARGVNATIAVVDRVGNVLALFRMNGADTAVTITSTPGSGNNVDGGLEQIDIIPDTLAVIAKAVTGAYLSSEGNAFTTRTASQIVQAHFNPGEFRTAGGPLFGVQFSQLPCSDLAARFAGGTAGPGPFRSPLGLSADPGGLPLYKNGTVVGGIGIMSDGIYGLSPKDLGGNANLGLVDEAIAVAGSFGYAAPHDRRSDRITVEGKTLRFTEVDFGGLLSSPDNAASFAAIDGVAGNLVADGPNQAYFNPAGGVLAGTAFSKAGSGIRASTNPAFAGQDAFVLVDAGNNPRFPPSAGTDGAGALTANEVATILSEALAVANRARAQIRRPLGSSEARVTISVVDTDGEILGIVRGRDAPMFGTDVSLQKARTAAFFSGDDAATELQAVPDAEYLDGGLTPLRTEPIGQYVTAVRSFLGDNTALTGGIAFADRSGGNLSRPFYPDGIDGNPPGPFSKPGGHVPANDHDGANPAGLPTQWSPFSVGLQLDLVYNAVIRHVGFAAGEPGVPDVPQNCTGIDTLTGGLGPMDTIDTVRNGIQIFPGSVPIYRGGQLVGGIGVSGDGIEQDDLISFLGLHNAGQRLGTVGNAPKSIRADKIEIPGSNVQLRYVQCPQAPFLDSNEQTVCDGK